MPTARSNKIRTALLVQVIILNFVPMFFRNYRKKMFALYCVWLGDLQQAAPWCSLLEREGLIRVAWSEGHTPDDASLTFEGCNRLADYMQGHSWPWLVTAVAGVITIVNVCLVIKLGWV